VRRENFFEECQTLTEGLFRALKAEPCFLPFEWWIGNWRGMAARAALVHRDDTGQAIQGVTHLSGLKWAVSSMTTCAASWPLLAEVAAMLAPSPTFAV
jgi:hypothetical protein